MTYGKAILIFIIGLTILFLLCPIVGMDTTLLGMLILLIVTMLLMIKAAFYSVRITNSKWKKKISGQEKSARFESIYEYVKNNYTYELELLRKELVKYLIIAGILLVISLIISVIIGYKTESEELGIYVLMPALTYTMYVYTKYNKKYQSKYKKYVIENFIRTMNHALTYENINNNKLDRLYRYAQFQNVSYDSFESEDYISGYIDGTLIEMSDVILKKKTKSEGKNTEYTCIFSHSQISKKVPQEIRLRNNKNPSKMENNRVELDNEEFEKYFDVFSDSRILVMEILTHDIMEEIIQFYNNSEINFEIVIKENRIYIRYEVGDIFEGKIFNKSTNKEALWICYNTLNFAINLTLKINKILEEKEV